MSSLLSAFITNCYCYHYRIYILLCFYYRHCAAFSFAEYRWHYYLCEIGVYEIKRCQQNKLTLLLFGYWSICVSIDINGKQSGYSWTRLNTASHIGEDKVGAVMFNIGDKQWTLALLVKSKYTFDIDVHLCYKATNLGWGYNWFNLSTTLY